MKNRTIELPFSRLSWPRIAMIAVLIGLLLYWLLGVRPYLHIAGARLSSPQLEIRADRMGRLTFAPFEEGSKVNKGEILFSLNSDEDQDQKQQLQATVESLQDSLSVYIASVEQATQGYITARSEVEMGLAPSDHCEQPLAVLQEQQTGANECKQQLAIAQKNLERHIQQAEKKTFLAPFGGVIVQRQKREGDVVQFGDVIYSFCDPSRIWVDAIVPEKHIAKVAVNQKATVQLLIDKGHQWEGSVAWISPVALPSGEGIPVRIQLEKCEGTLLKPNLSAEVKIKIH